MKYAKNLSFIVTLFFLTSCQTISPPAPSSIYSGEYQVPGRLIGTTSFAHEETIEKKINAKYPAWYRGNAANGMADEDSFHFYRVLIGPSAKTKLNPKNQMCGTYYLKPGVTYPAHNHPANEMYYVVDGEADWWADDENQKVRAGNIMYHRPYTVHGFTNTSKTKPLHLFWCWWVEPGEDPSVLNIGGRFTNPELFSSPETSKAHAVPIPKPHK